MNRTYWNQMAECYESQIFSVLHHDRAGRIAKNVRRFGRTNRTATDIGCGIGYFLPLLAGHFRKVLALDLSAKCIAKARAAHPRLANVTYRTVDLSAPGVRIPRADFALCVNSLISPALAPRNRMWDITCRHLRPGGHLVGVVPSLESAFLTDFRLIECNLRSGMKPGPATRSGFSSRRPGEPSRAHEGVLRIDRVETKHYLKEELQVLLKSRGMVPLKIEKIEYPWTTEYSSPPRWMQAPFPWDWLFVARNIRRR